MKATITLVLVLFVETLCSQHTDHFLEQTKAIQPSDTVVVEKFHKNGIIKEEGTALIYERPEYAYSRKFGNYKTYYKDGVLKSETVYDRFGNPMSAIFYNRNGTTWWKSETLEIDLAIEDPLDYFVSDRPISITKWNKEMKYGYDIDKMFLRSEGKIIDGAKIGTWKVYDELGRLLGQVDHDNK
ncbi:MAG: hypothetical protein KTR22_12815 [Flavobacteriaceae bacterium]|nr:hypothetical protein [Flavobacteriaceae bacterium]